MKKSLKNIWIAVGAVAALGLIAFMILLFVFGKHSGKLTNRRDESENLWEKGTESRELSYGDVTIWVEVPAGFYSAVSYEEDSGYLTECVWYQEEHIAMNLYLWKTVSDDGTEMSAENWIAKMNEEYFEDGKNHVQTVNVDSREISYIIVMEMDEEDQRNGHLLAVCPMREDIFYAVQVIEYNVKKEPEFADYERLFYERGLTP